MFVAPSFGGRCCFVAVVFKLLIKIRLGNGFSGMFLFLLKTASFFCLYLFFVCLVGLFVDFALGVLFSFLLIVAWVLLLWRLGFLFKQAREREF